MSTIMTGIQISIHSSRGNSQKLLESYGNGEARRTCAPPSVSGSNSASAVATWGSGVSANELP